MRNIRRVLEDDMDAANEATAVFGRLLSQLGDRLDGIEEQLRSIATRRASSTGSRSGGKAAGGGSATPAG